MAPGHNPAGKEHGGAGKGKRYQHHPQQHPTGNPTGPLGGEDGTYGVYRQREGKPEAKRLPGIALLRHLVSSDSYQIRSAPEELP